jgi:DMSO/TMAO reductase YedYZ molybdopterin-dependent catalytic subunit
MLSNTKRGFLVGLAGGVLALGVSFLVRIFFGGVFLPELAAQTLFSITPGSVESVAVVTLQSLAKYSAFTTAVVINLLLYGVLGALLFRSKSISEQGGRTEQFLSFSLLPYITLAAIGIVLLFTTAIQSSPVTLPELLISMVPPQLVFGATLTWFKGTAPLVTKPTELCEVAKPPKGKKFDRRRRLFIQAGVASAVGAAILVYGVGFLLRSSGSTSTVQANTSTLLAQDVTANANFYRVDVNIFPPSVNGSNWRLSVSGLVDTPLSLTLDQVQAMSFYDQYNTLECVSNTIGGDLISTAKWRGVRLKDVLSMAGVQDTAEYIVFTAVDGYDVAIPMDRAMLDGTLLAFEMNGEPLPTEHGYPLRAIVPGLYGMMNAKWIINIQAVSGPYQGYWQQRGWTSTAEYNTESEIVIPGDAQVTDRFGIDGSSDVSVGMVPIAGISFAGDRGISKVEVSTDGGNTWTVASLQDPLSKYTWVFWSAQWNPTRVGSYQLKVRATDGTGAVQTAVVTDPFPNGATGYQVVDISVLRPVTTSQTTTSSQTISATQTS